MILRRSFLAIAATVLAAFSLSQAVELTQDNYDERTAGKVVFLKFFDPMWGHCISMEPAWDELSEVFANSKSKVIGEIDCTTEEGKPICQDNGISSFPTVKYGSIDNLEDYEGPRDFDSLKAFADQHLKPACGIYHMQLCDKATRQEIRRLKKLSLAELDQELDAKMEAYNEIEKKSQQFIEDLEEYYAKAKEMKEKGQNDIMENEGLALMKACAKERGVPLDSDFAGNDSIAGDDSDDHRSGNDEL